jgi:multimeric flavodoxin WrbA
MKVVHISGSPRKQGNSAILSEKLVSALDSRDISRYYLYELDFKGCQGCMACRKSSRHCVINDEATVILNDIAAAEVTVIAAPVYQHYLNGETKCLLDRFFSYLSDDHFQRQAAGEVNIPTRLAAGKTLALLLAQGRPASMYTHLEPDLYSMLKGYGFSHVHVMRGCLLNSAKDIMRREDLWAEAAALAETIKRRY